MWIFGAETHATESGMDNAMYRWDSSDGLFKRMYAKSAWPGEYRVGSDGILYADAAYTKPWAMHTYPRIRFVEATKEIEVAYNPHSHAYWTTSLQDGATDQAGSTPPLWYYSTVTGTWRHSAATADIASYVNGDNICGSCHVDGVGLLTLGDTYARKLSDTGVYSSQNVYNNVNTAYHNHLFYLPTAGLVVKFGGNSGTFVASVHDASNLASSALRYPGDYAALSGYTLANNNAVLMPDERIMFLATGVDSRNYAFIFDPVANTVTATGESFGPQANANYDFKSAWSVEHDCAIFLTHRMGAAAEIYAYRI
jgi:hypothetical protein